MRCALLVLRDAVSYQIHHPPGNLLQAVFCHGLQSSDEALASGPFSQPRGSVAVHFNNDSNIICFQSRQSSTPNATDLTTFITPAIELACSAFNLANGSSETVATYNHTGYIFAKLNVDQNAANDTECKAAFAAITSACVRNSASFGGQWSPRLSLSYILTNIAYPDSPITNDQPPAGPTTSPTSTSVGATSTRTSDVSTTTAPSVPSHPGHPGQDVIEAVALIAAAAAAFVAVSFVPLLNKAAAVAVVSAIESAVPVGSPSLKKGHTDDWLT